MQLAASATVKVGVTADLQPPSAETSFRTADDHGAGP